MDKASRWLNKWAIAVKRKNKLFFVSKKDDGKYTTNIENTILYETSEQARKELTHSLLGEEFICKVKVSVLYRVIE